MLRMSAVPIALLLVAAGCKDDPWTSVSAAPAPAGKKCFCGERQGTPLDVAKIHICAFHVGKEDPKIQLEIQHYCSPVSDELFQCLLYDSHAKSARLIGVEYVISHRLYQGLSEDEKKLWHPHEFEIREGLLATPGMDKECEQKTMKALLRTWGKTWHTWPDFSTALPVGKPMLMWSAVKTGDVRPELVQERDRRFTLRTEEIKKEREKYLKD